MREQRREASRWSGKNAETGFRGLEGVSPFDVEEPESITHSRLAPLNLLASCSLSDLGEADREEAEAEGKGRRPAFLMGRGSSDPGDSDGDDEDGGSVAVLSQGRLGGRSPLSCRIVTSVAQPGVLISCIPSAGLREVATRQRRDSSSWGVGGYVSMRLIILRCTSRREERGHSSRPYFAEGGEVVQEAQQVEI